MREKASWITTDAPSFEELISSTVIFKANEVAHLSVVDHERRDGDGFSGHHSRDCAFVSASFNMSNGFSAGENPRILQALILE